MPRVTARPRFCGRDTKARCELAHETVSSAVTLRIRSLIRRWKIHRHHATALEEILVGDIDAVGDFGLEVGIPGPVGRYRRFGPGTG